MRARLTAPIRARSVRSAAALTLVAGTALLAGASLAPASAAPVPQPSLRLFSADADHAVSRPKGEPVWVALPLFATPVGGTFDLRVSRADFESPVTISQVVQEEDGSHTSYPLPDMDTKNWKGLGGFTTLTITDPHGDVVAEKTRTFCPNTWNQQRVDPDGVDTPTFGYGCNRDRLTLGDAWGIDDGWATPVDRRGAVVLDGPKGDYTVTATVAPEYQETFGIDPADASASVVYHVSNGPRDHEEFRKPVPAAAAQKQTPRPNVKILAAPPSDNLPDLQSLPSFAIGVDHRGSKDWLAFASNVWVGGSSKLDIEGFRRPGEDIMDAYQYFYDGDEVVGRAAAGTLEFDTRRGHHHWHLQQFARYRLLDLDQQHVERSKKQSFCLAPTNAINLAIDGAARRQSEADLGSACGGDEAIWIRETLPVGWGDTYYQSRGGQDFNITDVPNGAYYIAVEANPTGELFETDTTNNTALRKVILKGTPGHRKVCVPAVGALRAEGTCAGGNG